MGSHSKVELAKLIIGENKERIVYMILKLQQLTILKTNIDIKIIF